MSRKWLLVPGVLAVLAGLGAVSIWVISESRLNRSYDIPLEPVTVPSDSAAIARGRYLGTSLVGCSECHREDLGGTLVIPAPVGPIFATNLTRGNGGIGSAYSDAEMIRAIRHGVKRDGRAILVMPSVDQWRLSDADVAAVVAWVRSLPPVNFSSESGLGPLGRFLVVAGKLAPAADEIEHDLPRPPAPPRGPTAEYGEYLAALGCAGCHGPRFSGGPVPGVPSDWPPALNLTPGGELAAWSENEFLTAMRTGTTPTGRALALPYMPWKAFSGLTDDDLRAIFAYLKTVTPRPDGAR